MGENSREDASGLVVYHLPFNLRSEFCVQMLIPACTGASHQPADGSSRTHPAGDRPSVIIRNKESPRHLVDRVDRQVLLQNLCRLALKLVAFPPLKSSHGEDCRA